MSIAGVKSQEAADVRQSQKDSGAIKSTKLNSKEVGTCSSSPPPPDKKMTYYSLRFVQWSFIYTGAVLLLILGDVNESGVDSRMIGGGMLGVGLGADALANKLVEQ